MADSFVFDIFSAFLRLDSSEWSSKSTKIRRFSPVPRGDRKRFRFINTSDDESWSCYNESIRDSVARKRRTKFRTIRNADELISKKDNFWSIYWLKAAEMKENWLRDVEFGKFEKLRFYRRGKAAWHERKFPRERYFWLDNFYWRARRDTRTGRFFSLATRRLLSPIVRYLLLSDLFHYSSEVYTEYNRWLLWPKKWHILNHALPIFHSEFSKVL